MSLEQNALESTIATASGKTTYIGTGTTAAGFVFSSEFAMLVGLLLGVAGFLVNTYYRVKQDRRDQLEHELRVAAATEDKKALSQ